jgi:replicative DNA helicase
VSKTADENDKLMKGALPSNPEEGTRPVGKVVPMNKAAAEEARRKAEEARILTVRQVVEASVTRARSKAPREFCTTGHVVLDDATGGIMPGHGWVFAAETNWGKSSWLVSVADENLLLGKKVLIVSNEDDEQIYGDRLVARRSGVMASHIRSGDLSDFEEEKLEQVLRNAENVPVYLDARGKTAEWTAKQVEKLLDDTKLGIDLVAYDYLQEFPAQRQQENHRLTVKYVAKLLRTVVKVRKKASIIFSQITVDEKNKGSAPNRNMIRDCRDVANAAEVILIGYTPERAVQTKKGATLVTADCRAVWVDKVKQGRKKFAVAMDWDDDTASFRAVRDGRFNGGEPQSTADDRRQETLL